ncbi:uncharacterized protein [Nicotiana sylvestris]|uniref:uncharacterized protein n=1 Tax=Nicotiana sylvestris TaxID=4096 RepID=UPI00388C647E
MRHELIQFKKELSMLSEGSCDIELIKLWDELDSLNSNSCCSCDCQYDGKVKTIKDKETLKLNQFLIGLNDSYSGTIRNITMMKPTPNIGQTCSLLLQDEKSESRLFHTMFLNQLLSLLVPHQKGRHILPKQISLVTKKSNNYCKKPGHTIDKYNRFHGLRMIP